MTAWHYHTSSYMEMKVGFAFEWDLTYGDNIEFIKRLLGSLAETESLPLSPSVSLYDLGACVQSYVWSSSQRHKKPLIVELF